MIKTFFKYFTFCKGNFENELDLNLKVLKIQLHAKLQYYCHTYFIKDIFMYHIRSFYKEY